MWPQSCWPQGQCFPWNSPHVLGTGWACRESSGGCQGSGAPALRGSQRHLPRTHQRENLSAPPRAAPSQLETLKAALAPGVGWAGTGPPTHVPPSPGAAARLPCLLKNLSVLHSHCPGPHREKEDPPCRGTGEAAQKGSSPAQDPQGTPKRLPLCHHIHRVICVGGILCFKHDSLFLPLPSNHEQALPQPFSFHMCRNILITPAWQRWGGLTPIPDLMPLQVSKPSRRDIFCS